MFVKDGNFKKPKVSVLLSIDTPHCYVSFFFFSNYSIYKCKFLKNIFKKESPRTTQLSYMFVNCVTDQLNEYSYDAELAGIIIQKTIEN